MPGSNQRAKTASVTSHIDAFDPNRRLQRSQLMTRKNVAMNEQKSCWTSFKSFWIGGKTSLIIWMCRAISFVWVYCYHDWQSVILLIWLLHSTLYRDSQFFQKCMIFFYLPLVTTIFLWYYTINIFGLIAWTSDPT